MSFESALQLHREGQLESAEAAYRELLTENDDPEVAYMLGVVRYQRGDDGEAESLIRRAVDRSPETARYYLALGGVQMHRGEDNAARASFERALELDPNSAEAHGVLGHLTFLDGDAEAAENRFKIGRRADDEDPMILLGLGNVYLSRNDAENAGKFLARAAANKPDDAAIQFSFGRALLEQGAYATADLAFENALKSRPNLSVAKLYLARSKLRADKLDDAQVLFAQLLDQGQQLFGANAGLGDVARKRNQVVRAHKFYRRALQIDPAHHGAIGACAWCMDRLGQPNLAADYLSEGLKNAPEAEDVRTQLVKLLERLGRHEEAARFRERRDAA